LTYWKTVPALSNSNTSNWLLAAYPDAYFYGALAQTGTYLKADASSYVTFFQAILSDIVESDKVARFAPHLEVARVKGTTP
jgi:hypothetical protein